MLGKMLGFGRNENYDKAIRLFDQGLYEEAIEAFARPEPSGKRDTLTERLAKFYTAEAHANLGQCALKRRRLGACGASLPRGAEDSSALRGPAFQPGACASATAEVFRRLESLDNALQINPRFAKAHFHRGLALYASGKREDGVEAICKALEIEHGFDTDACRAGIQKHYEGDYAAALHALEMVSATDVDDILFHFRLGDDLYRRGLFQDAIEEYDKALELNPSYADVHNHRGIALSAFDRPDEALESFQSALEINPDYVEARLNLGVTLRGSRPPLGCHEGVRERAEVGPGEHDRAAEYGRTDGRGCLGMLLLLLSFYFRPIPASRYSANSSSVSSLAAR